MIKKFFNIVLTIIFFTSLVLAVRYKQNIVRIKEQKQIVTFPTEWQEHGKPVYVQKIQPRNTEKTTKMTIFCNEDNKFHSYVSKTICDALQEDAKISVLDNEENIEGKITLLSDQLDQDIGLYRVEGTFSSDVKKQNEKYIAKAFTKTYKNVFILPEDVIDTEDTQSFVWVAINNQCIKKPITIENHKNGNVLVKQGLNQGDLVILKGSKNLLNNEKINILNREENND